MFLCVVEDKNAFKLTQLKLGTWLSWLCHQFLNDFLIMFKLFQRGFEICSYKECFYLHKFNRIGYCISTKQENHFRCESCF